MKSFLAILAVLVLMAGGLWYISRVPEGGGTVVVPTTTTPTTTSAATSKSFRSEQYGLAFTYPSTYVVVEHDATSTQQRGHHVVMLVEDTPSNRALVGGTATTAGEGPIAITFDFYENTKPVQTAEDWVQDSPNSNFNLSPDKVLATTTISTSTRALRYRWSGLYEAENIAFTHKGNIVSAAVTYLTPDDAIRRDFSDIIHSLQLLP